MSGADDLEIFPVNK